MSTETKTEPKVEFNERTFEAFEKEKLDIPHGIVADKERYDKFRSKFKEEKGKLQKIIKSMHRRPIISYDQGTGKAIKKDVLSYVSEYHGYDWLGNDLWIRDHVDGIFYKPKFRINTTLDPETGDHKPNKVFDGMTEEYYIELTEKNRKQVIEDIVNKSNGTMRRDGETSKIHAITYSVLQETPKIIHGVIDMIYETLKKLSDNQRKQPSYIFLDETDNKI
jgi:hypothetical protein